MDELDLYRALSDSKEKTAGVKDFLKSLATPENIGMAAGAAAGAGTGYVTSKRWKKDVPSSMEAGSARMLHGHDTADKLMSERGIKPGFGHKLHGVAARAYVDLARLAKEHPAAIGAMFGASSVGLGAAAGHQVGELIRRIKR